MRNEKKENNIISGVYEALGIDINVTYNLTSGVVSVDAVNPFNSYDTEQLTYFAAESWGDAKRMARDRVVENVIFTDGEPLESFLTEALAVETGEDVETVEILAEASGYEPKNWEDVNRLKDVIESGFLIEPLDMAGMCSEDEALGYVLAETMEIPENLVMYINYEAIGRDCRLNDGGSYVYHDNNVFYVEC